MAWCRTGDKPLHELMMIKLSEAHLLHKDSMCSLIHGQKIYGYQTFTIDFMSVMVYCVPWIYSIFQFKIYAHSFVTLYSLCCNYIKFFWWVHIHQGCFSGIQAIIRLPQCWWNNPEGYWYKLYTTATKHNKAQTMSILGHERGPSGVSPNQCSQWKHVFSLLKNCLTYAFVTQQPFGIPYWNLDTWIFVPSTTSVFHHTIVSVIVLAVLPQWDLAVHATGPIAIASIQAVSTTNSIHRG